MSDKKKPKKKKEEPSLYTRLAKAGTLGSKAQVSATTTRTKKTR